MNRSSQASLEFLVLVGIALTIMIPVILLVNSYKENISDAKTYVAVKDLLKKLKSSAYNTYMQGEGSKTTLYVYIPSSISYFNIEKNYIHVRIRTSLGEEDMVVFFPFNVSSTSLPSRGGSYEVVITSLIGGVVYEFREI